MDIKEETGSFENLLVINNEVQEIFTSDSAFWQPACTRLTSEMISRNSTDQISSTVGPFSWMEDALNSFQNLYASALEGIFLMVPSRESVLTT